MLANVKINSNPSLSLPIQFLLILAICLLSYGKSFNNGFMLDDYNLFLDDGSLKDLNTPFNLFIQEFHGFYRPLGIVFIWSTYKLFGTNIFGYHFSNFLLFYTICALFLILLRKILQNNILSFLAVCLYAAHPINAGLVNYKTLSYFGLGMITTQISILFFYC